MNGRLPTPFALPATARAAGPTAPGVVVASKTANEQDLKSLNLFRAGSPDGRHAQLDDALVAAGLPGSHLGHTFSFTGPGVAPGASLDCGLETLYSNGIVQTGGPVSVKAGSGTIPHLDLPIAPR